MRSRSLFLVCAAGMLFGSNVSAQGPKGEVKKLEAEIEELKAKAKELEAKLQKAKEAEKAEKRFGPPFGGRPFGGPPFGKFDPAKAKEMKEAFEKMKADFMKKRETDAKPADTKKEPEKKKGPPPFAKSWHRHGWGGPPHHVMNRSPSLESRLDRITRELEDIRKELKRK